MSRPDQAARRRAIAAELHVSPTFDARDEAERRIGFVADYLRTAGLRACVLGISGGIDSSSATAARTCCRSRASRNAACAHSRACWAPTSRSC